MSDLTTIASQGQPLKPNKRPDLFGIQSPAPRAKLAERLLVHPRWTRASARFGWLSLALFLGGCPIVTDPVYLDPIPNRPPYLIEDSAQPARRISVPALPGCAVTFRIQAEDPDVDDTLISRWYIDYDAVNNPAPYAEAELPYAEAAAGAVRQRIPATITIHLDAANNPLPVGDHVVEVLVADGALVNREPTPRAPIGTFPDGGEITDTSYAVSYAWFVEVTDEGAACP
jgi:hypothetical protein